MSEYDSLHTHTQAGIGFVADECWTLVVVQRGVWGPTELGTGTTTHCRTMRAGGGGGDVTSRPALVGPSTIATCAIARRRRRRAGRQ